MEKYLGVKLISAEPEVKIGIAGDENTLRELGVETVLDGYKVVYGDDYVSWSPKDVFEKAYRKVDLELPSFTLPIAEHQERVVKEMLELKDKTDKLESFIINNPIFPKIQKEEQDRLQQQLLAMKYYLIILIERIKAF